MIELPNIPRLSFIVLFSKKDGSTRFCVDYRKLKDITKKGKHSKPRIDDTLDLLTSIVWLTTLDLKTREWKVEAHPDDKKKTSFAANTGLWQLNVMLFC